MGYNYGAKKFGRVRALLRLIIQWMASVCLICTVLLKRSPYSLSRCSARTGHCTRSSRCSTCGFILSLILFTCVQKVCVISGSPVQSICFDRLVNTQGTNLCFRPLRPAMEITASIVWKKYQVFTKAAEKFLLTLQELVKEAEGKE